MATINVRELQTPIREQYRQDPQAGQITLKVRSAESDLADPLHCAVLPVSTPEITWWSGPHPAVGGTGDVPCSGVIRSGTTVRVPGDVRRERADRLLRSAEKYCVVLNTLRNGVAVESSFSLEQAPNA